MAYFRASGGSETIYWEAELSQPFIKDYYLQMGLCREEFGNGGTVPPESILYPVVEAKSTPMYGDVDSDDSKYVTGQIDNVPSGTYIVYCFAQRSAGDYWYVPEASSTEDVVNYYAEVTVSSSGGGDTPPPSVKPTPWDWNLNEDRKIAYQILCGTLPVSAGFKASVWNDIVHTVNNALEYDGFKWSEWGEGQLDGPVLPFEQCLVKPGDVLSAAMYKSLVCSAMNVGHTPIFERAKLIMPGVRLTRQIGQDLIELLEITNEYIYYLIY